MEEIWKPIEKFENYEISNFGRVKSLPKLQNKYKETILKQHKKKSGYLQVTLSKNGKLYFFSVHRLVANAFLNKENFKYIGKEKQKKINFEKLEINHKDEDKTNNCIDNLEWCTASYNRNYGTAIARAKPKISKANKGKHFSIHTEFKQGDNSKKIICIELNKIYNSIIQASIDLNINACNIVCVCKHKQHHKTAGGYHFEYV